MARGAQTDPQTIYNIIASYAVTNNYRETARLLKIPASTVTKIVKDNIDKPEFVKLCAEKKEDFAAAATEVIDKGLFLLNRRFDVAIRHEGTLERLIDEIYSSDKKELSQDEKNRLVSQIRILQLQRIGDITTAIGTLYDKRALAQGESTGNFTYTMPDEVKKYAE